MKPVRPAPPVHHPTGELVDDDDLPVLHDVVDVLLEHHIGLERLVQVMNNLRIGNVVEIPPLDEPRGLQHPLCLLGAFFRQDDALLLLVLVVIGLGQGFHEAVDGDVEVRLVIGRSGDDQRSPRLVDQDRIDLVDDREIEWPLDHLLARIFHVVAQIVEAELVVRRVGDVGIIGVAPFLVGEVGHDHADAHPEEPVDLAHPVGVAAGEIVVYGDDVDALSLECIEVDRERGDERLAFAGLHLGDLAAVERDATDQLDVVVALAERPDRRFSNRGKSFGDQLVELLAVGQPPPEKLGLAHELVVAQRGNIRLEAVDRIDIFAEAADIAIVGRSEDAFCH